MWEIKLRRVRIHGGSTVYDNRKTYDHLHRSKHFAIESPWYYVHVGASNNRHADRDPLLSIRASGVPERYKGTIHLHAAFTIGRRFRTSHDWSFDYGRETLDWIDMERESHLSQYPEEVSRS